MPSLRHDQAAGCHHLGRAPAAPLPRAGRLFDGIFEDLLRCQCISLRVIPTESFTWDYLQGEGSRSRRYFLHLPSIGEQKWHLIDLRDGFDKYLGAMSGKTRYTLRKKVRVLREHGGGRLECRHVEAEDQVEAFLEAAERVRARSWQEQKLGPRKLSGEPALVGPEAQRLGTGQVPPLLPPGMRWGAMRTASATSSMACTPIRSLASTRWPLSPGTVLIYLMLEDLFGATGQLFNFGPGNQEYKERFGNQTSKYVQPYLLRRNLANRLRHMSLGVFSSGVCLAKRRAEGRTPGRNPAEVTALEPAWASREELGSRCGRRLKNRRALRSGRPRLGLVNNTVMARHSKELGVARTPKPRAMFHGEDTSDTEVS